MMKKARKKVPELRFPEFNGDWKTDRADYFLVRYVNPVDVQLDTEYEQIGIRSHGKGIFHKEPVTGRELGNKRVYWVHPEAFTVNIVFAWEQAVALTSNAEKGFIASHRFLMFLPKENRVDLKFILLFFLRKRGKSLLELASPGGAGRNKTLGQDNFAELQLTLPQKEEQEKIASFLGAVDTRISQLRRKHELLQTYKRGVMQKIFSQQIRFKSNDGQPFRDWQDKKLNDLFKWVRTNSLSRDALSFESGTIQNIHYGDIHKKFKSQFLLSKEEVPYIIDEIFASNIDLEDFCKIGDLVIADASEDYADIGKAIEIIEVEPNKLVAGLHCFIARPKGAIIVGYSGYLFKSENIRKQIKKIAQGISVLGISKTNLEHLNVPLPCIEEQAKIADFLTAIDKKIEAIAQQIELTEQFKKSLLQKMFV